MLSLVMALLIAASSAPSHKPQLIPASEAYMYGHYLGKVTVSDIAIEGNAVTLKGMQYWPRLQPDTDAQPVGPPSPIAQLMTSVGEMARAATRRGEPVALVRRAMADSLRASPLVSEVREPKDPNAPWFEYRRRSDPNGKWIVVQGIGGGEKPSRERVLERMVADLKREIEWGLIIIVAPGGEVTVPQEMKADVESEIAAARRGEWTGGILPEDIAETFTAPLDLEAATARYRKGQSSRE